MSPRAINSGNRRNVGNTGRNSPAMRLARKAVFLSKLLPIVGSQDALDRIEKFIDSIPEFSLYEHFPRCMGCPYKVRQKRKKKRRRKPGPKRKRKYKSWTVEDRLDRMRIRGKDGKLYVMHETKYSALVRLIMVLPRDGMWRLVKNSSLLIEDKKLQRDCVEGIRRWYANRGWRADQLKVRWGGRGLMAKWFKGEDKVFGPVELPPDVDSKTPTGG